MAELVIMRGLPGVGKTTYATAWVAQDRANRARVNRDTLRVMIDDGEFVKGVTEGRILAARDAVITALLKQGVSVICDDTNLPSRTVRDLQKLAIRQKADWTVTDMTDVPLEVCLKRNTIRTDKDPVPSPVITDMHARFIKGRSFPLPVADEVHEKAEVVPYIPDPSLPKAIIVDIDGTVALHGSRDPFDETRVHEDHPNEAVIKIVRAMADAGYHVIFLSGRTDACQDATMDWLDKHVAVSYELHMRKAGDGRKDWIVKQELFDSFVRDKYNVACVFDDRDQVVQLWRAMGLTCSQVAEGNF